MNRKKLNVYNFLLQIIMPDKQNVVYIYMYIYIYIYIYIHIHTYLYITDVHPYICIGSSLTIE